MQQNQATNPDVINILGGTEPQNPAINPSAEKDEFLSKTFHHVNPQQKEMGVKIVRELIEAQADGVCDADRLANISAQVDSLKTQIGPSLLYGIASLPVEERALASSAIEMLGRYRDAWPGETQGRMVLSRLGLAVFMSYVRAIEKEDIRRFVLGFFQSLLPEKDRNVDEFCHYFGCGRFQAQRGLKEYCTNEFNWGLERTRQPGAGGPSVHDKTTEALLPVVAATFGMAIGAGEQDKPSQDQSDPTGSKVEGVPVKGKEEVPSEKDKTDEASKTFIFESISESAQGLDDIVAKAKAVLSAAMEYAEKNCERKYLNDMILMIDQGLAFINTSIENIRPCPRSDNVSEDEQAAEGMDTDLIDEQATEGMDDGLKEEQATDGMNASAEDEQAVEGVDVKELIHGVESEVEKRFKAQLAGSSLDGLQSSLRTICSHLLDIFTPTDCGDVRHQQIKDATIRVSNGHWRKRLIKEIQACVAVKQEAHRLAKAFIASLTAPDGSAPQIEVIDLVGNLKKPNLRAFKARNLEAIRLLVSKLEAFQDNSFAKSPLEFLRSMEKTMDSEILEEHLRTESMDLRAALLIFLHYVTIKVVDWKNRLESEGTANAVLRQICMEVDQKRFRRTYERWLGDYRDAVARAAVDAGKEGVPAQVEDQTGLVQGGVPTQAPDGPNVSPEDKQEAGAYAMPSVDDARTAWDERKETAFEAIHRIQEILLSVGDAKQNREYNQPDRTQEAYDYLGDLERPITELDEKARKSDDPTILMALARFAATLRDRLVNRMEVIESRLKADGTITYSVANTIAASILTKRFKGRIDALIGDIKKECAGPGEETSSVDHCTELNVNEDDVVHKMFFAEGHVTPLELCKIVAELLAKGEDPLNPTAWIDYIIDRAGMRDLYGDAADDKKYCSINRRKLGNAFRYLTGLTICENSLYGILTGPMGFSKQQCAKLEQVGMPHPQKYEQLDRIERILKELDLDKVLILSIDTKSGVKLGRLKTPGGVFMCSVGTTVAVCDHDFPFKLHEIYVKRCELFTEEEWESWKDELAVLRPVGVYCLNDRSAYIGLVLVKDTAESMCNTILKAVLDKKKSMPHLEKVVLLADGGGANMANGIAWTHALKQLADKIRMRIDILHYPPGCSKYNRVEHELFGPLSRYWKNLPLLTIEHVGTHICEMAECFPRISKIHVWLDKRHYKTQKEILKNGGVALTRNDNDGRIISDYEEGSAMRKWNYSALPSML